MSKLSDEVKDATAPLVVANTLSRLSVRFGTHRVVAAVKGWLDYMEQQRAFMDGDA